MILVRRLGLVSGQTTLVQDFVGGGLLVFDNRIIGLHSIISRSSIAPALTSRTQLVTQRGPELRKAELVARGEELARMSASAMSPRKSRSRNAGMGRRGLKPSTLPSVAKNSAFRTGFGPAALTGPSNASVTSPCCTMLVISSRATQLIHC